MAELINPRAEAVKCLGTRAVKRIEKQGFRIEQMRDRSGHLRAEIEFYISRQPEGEPWAGSWASLDELEEIAQAGY